MFEFAYEPIMVCRESPRDCVSVLAVAMMDVFTQSGDQDTDTFATPAAPIIASSATYHPLDILLMASGNMSDKITKIG